MCELAAFSLAAFFYSRGCTAQDMWQIVDQSRLDAGRASSPCLDIPLQIE